MGCKCFIRRQDLILTRKWFFLVPEVPSFFLGALQIYKTPNSTLIKTFSTDWTLPPGHSMPILPGWVQLEFYRVKKRVRLEIIQINSCPGMVPKLLLK